MLPQPGFLSSPGRPPCTRAAWLLALAAVLGSGCASWKDHLKAGRHAQACRAAMDDAEDRDAFTAWVRKELRTRAVGVPLAEVEQHAGAPVAEYGAELGVYRLSGEVPGATTVDVEVVNGALDPAWLVVHMPPLWALKEPVLPPGPYSAQDFLPVEPPAPARATSSSGSFFGALTEAFIGVGKAVGGAVGLAVAIPLALTVGILVGGVEVVSDVAGGYNPYRVRWLQNRGGAESLVAPAPYVRLDPAPVFMLTPARASGTADALLDAHDHARLVEARTADAADGRARAEAEQARRVAWAASPPVELLSCPPVMSRAVPACSLLLKPGTINAWVTATFGKGPGACRADPVILDIPVEPMPVERPPWPVPVPPVAVDLLDQQAPSWVHQEPVPTTMPPGTAPAVTALAHAWCELRPGKLLLRQKKAPDLAVRITAGRDTPRVQRWALGHATGPRDALRFLVPGLSLQPGERLRVAVTDTGAARSLGGGIVEFTGALPMVVENDAVSITCRDVDEPAREAAAREASVALESSLAGLEAAVAAGDAPGMVAGRAALRTSLARLASLRGWRAPEVAEALAAMLKRDPAESRDAPAAPR